MKVTSRGRLALLALVSAAIAGWIYLDWGPSSTPPGPAPDPRAQISPASGGVGAPAAALPASTTVAATGLSVVLSGVVVGTGGGNLAIVSVDRRPETMLRVGDELAPTVTIERIDAASLSYRFAGQMLQVFVQPARSVAAVAPASAPLPTLPGFVAGAPPMARTGSSDPGSGNEAFRQAVKRKAQAITSGH